MWTKLMVVGGYPSASYGKAEIIDLSGQGLTCPTITDFPIDYGSVGTFINNKTLVCGGTQGSAQLPDCYSYNMQVNLVIIKYLVMLYVWTIFILRLPLGIQNLP